MVIFLLNRRPGIYYADILYAADIFASDKVNRLARTITYYAIN